MTTHQTHVWLTERIIQFILDTFVFIVWSNVLISVCLCRYLGLDEFLQTLNMEGLSLLLQLDLVLDACLLQYLQHPL